MRTFSEARDNKHQILYVWFTFHEGDHSSTGENVLGQAICDICVDEAYGIIWLCREMIKDP